MSENHLYTRIAEDLENAPGIQEVIQWVEESRPSQVELQAAHVAIKGLRLGHAPVSEEEVVQAAFARGSDKVLRHAIQQQGGSSGVGVPRSGRIRSLKVRK